MNKETTINKYFQTLLQDFECKFNKYKNKKIVLYGIGAFSETVINVLDEYNIIGLMDRDPENIGKRISGVPVLSIEDVEKSADLVIINTEPSYWQTIYKRIVDIKVDVYFRDGNKAYVEEKSINNENLEYWNCKKEDLLDAIDRNDVISFDIFDTLITRKVYLPADVFQLIEKKVQKELKSDLEFVQIRTNALHSTGAVEPDYDDIYNRFAEISGLDKKIVNRIKEIEIETEEELFVTRYDILDIFEYAKNKGKEIVLTSDMYYSSEQLKIFIDKLGYSGYKKIFVSCECKKNKADGSLYQILKNEFDNKKILHIGDNYYSDYMKAKEAGIHAFYIMSGRDIMKNSSLGEILPEIVNIYDSVLVGMIIAKIFNSPFAVNTSKGITHIDNEHRMGYVVYGPIIASFTLWLYKEIREDKIKQVLFFARDGYFLKNYFDVFIEEDDIKSEYFIASRRLCAVVSIENENDYREIAALPYKGPFYEYMLRRWNVEIDSNDENAGVLINTAVDLEKILHMMEKYEVKIMDSIRKEKENYAKYIKKVIVGEEYGFVDTWYYGHCQYYISKFLGKRTKGYYFAANLTDNNVNYVNNEIKSCYNDKNNPTCKDVSCTKYSLNFESIFTAPHGMVRSVMENGEFIYEKKGKNQLEFSAREQIDIGVKEYLLELIRIFGKDLLCSISINYKVGDKMYGLCFDGGVIIEKEILSKMYNENFFQSNEEFLVME